MSTTQPLALSVPQICERFGSSTRFQTIEVEEGWTNVVVSPGRMLKLCQLSTAFWPACTVSCEPLCVALAEPCATVMPVGFAFARSPPRQAATASAHTPVRQPLLSIWCVLVFRIWTARFMRYVSACCRYFRIARGVVKDL